MCDGPFTPVEDLVTTNFDGAINEEVDHYPASGGDMGQIRSEPQVLITGHSESHPELPTIAPSMESPLQLIEKIMIQASIASRDLTMVADSCAGILPETSSYISMIISQLDEISDDSVTVRAYMSQSIFLHQKQMERCICEV